MSRYANKRLHVRTPGGQFRKAVAADLGIGGTCPACHHLLLRHYGDPRERPVDPRKFRYRCFTCEPETEAEKALAKEIEAGQPRRETVMEFFERAAREAQAQENKAGGDLPPEGKRDERSERLD